MSVFLKEIENPIQATIGNKDLEIQYNGTVLNWGTGSNTFVNSDSAEVYGLELEWKKGLEEYSEYLNGFRIGGNLTWSQSEVKLSEMEMTLFPDETIQPDYRLLNVSNRSTRALEGQSEWIYTFDLSYSNEDLGLVSTLVYSYYDTRLHAAAFQYPDDLWEDGFSTLDFINSYKFGSDLDWAIKASAKNLTAEKRIVRVLGTSSIEEQYETPRVFSISLEKKF